MAGVSVDQVTIVSVAAVGARRRLLQNSGIQVETEIVDDGFDSLATIEADLTTDNINAYLVENDVSTLPAMTVEPVETTASVVEEIEFDFDGASSYAEAAISLRLDAVSKQRFETAFRKTVFRNRSRRV